MDGHFEDGAWYHARVEEVHFEESSGQNTPGIAIRWIVADGSEMDGKPVYDQRWISPKNIARQVKDFDVLGFDIKKKPLRLMPDELRGKEAEIQVQIQEFPPNSGTMSVKVGRVKPPGVGGEDDLIKKIEGIIGNETRELDEWEKEKKF
jgi:hypothetical protein